MNENDKTPTTNGETGRRLGHRSAYSNRSYFNAADFHKPRVMTIDEIRAEKTPNSKKKNDRPELVAYFEGEELGIVLNVTNQDFLEQLSGSGFPNDWEGLTVEVYCKPDCKNPNGPGVVEGIRFRRPPMMKMRQPHKPVPMTQAHSELPQYNENEAIPSETYPD